MRLVTSVESRRSTIAAVTTVRAVMHQTVAMPMQSVSRRWTVASWLLARHDDRLDAISDAVRAVGADAFVAQSIGEGEAERLAGSLGFHRTWAISHHPHSRLLPGSGVGLAVMTPHEITSAIDTVISESSSLWSTHRRIAQAVLVDRADHSGYVIAHAVAEAGTVPSPSPGAPMVRVHPARVATDPDHAIELPDTCTDVAISSSTPVEGMEPMVVASFDMLWVQGDFPTP